MHINNNKKKLSYVSSYCFIHLISIKFLLILQIGLNAIVMHTTSINKHTPTHPDPNMHNI